MPHPSDLTRRTSWEVADALKAGQTTAIIVLGANEQHGPHLPLGTDTLWGTRVAQRVAERTGAFVAPPIAVGFSPEHMAFPGTITLRAATWAAVVDDYVSSLEAHGFTRILLLSSHGGNYPPLIDALPGLRNRHPKTEIIAYTDLLGLIAAAAAVSVTVDVTADESGAHAGELETSLILAIEPDTVHRDREEIGYMGDLAPVLDQINEHGLHTVAPNGILGDPTKASAEHGYAYLEAFAALFADLLATGECQ